jgi:hypothetical protein
MALYHKWDVKNDFAYVLQFLSLISDSLGTHVLMKFIFTSFRNHNTPLWMAWKTVRVAERGARYIGGFAFYQFVPL